MAGHLQAAVEETVLQVAKQLEAKLDTQLQKLDHLQDDDLDRIRQQRIDAMKRQQEKTREWLTRGHGEYVQLADEKEFFKEMKGEERMLCHFYRDNWPCKVVDKHLGILCRQHLETKFCRIDAEKSPYLTEKLKIWMLPTIALIKAEKVVDYVVGFDELGGKDDFSTEQLADRLARSDIIRADTITAVRPQQQQQHQRSGIRKGGAQRTESDEDSDFDDL